MPSTISIARPMPTPDSIEVNGLIAWHQARASNERARAAEQRAGGAHAAASIADDAAQLHDRTALALRHHLDRAAEW